MSFRPDEAVSVTTGARHAADWCVGKKAWLVSGIGNSDSFRRLAMANGVQVLGETAFADHHAYRSEELARIRVQATRSNADMVLTTEKDAGKLASLLMPDDPWWALRLRADVKRGQDALHRLLFECSDRPVRDARA